MSGTYPYYKKKYVDHTCHDEHVKVIYNPRLTYPFMVFINEDDENETMGSANLAFDEIDEFVKWFNQHRDELKQIDYEENKLWEKKYGS